MTTATRSRGIILLVSFIVLMLLIIVVTQLSTFVTSNKIASANYSKGIAVDKALLSMYHYSIAYLKKDIELDKNTSRTDVDVDFLQEPWAVAGGIKLELPYKDEKIQLSSLIKDCNRSLNINFIVGPAGEEDALIKDSLARLISATGHALAIDALVDLIKKRGAPLTSYEQLKEIGVTDDDLNGTGEIPALTNFITLWPYPEVNPDNRAEYKNKNDWKININTATKEVLMAISGKVTAEIADAIIAFRTGTEEKNGLEVPKFFNSQDEISTALEEAGINTSIAEVAAAISELKDRSIFNAIAFTIEIKATLDNSERTWMHVVKVKETPQDGGGSVTELEKVLSYPIIRYKFPHPDEIR